jgi:hypothetical protein
MACVKHNFSRPSLADAGQVEADRGGFLPSRSLLNSPIFV